MDIFPSEIIQNNLNALSKIIEENLNFLAIIAFLIGISVIFLAFLFFLAFCLNKMNELLTTRFVSPQAKRIYQRVFYPYQKWLKSVASLILIDLVLLIVPLTDLLKYFGVSNLPNPKR